MKLGDGVSGLGGRGELVVLRREKLSAEKRRAELYVTRWSVLREGGGSTPSGSVVTRVDGTGDRGTDLLASAGMEEDPFIKVALGQYSHLVFTVQRFAAN